MVTGGSAEARNYLEHMEQAFERPPEEDDDREIRWRRENGLCEQTGRRPETCCCSGCLGEQKVEGGVGYLHSVPPSTSVIASDVEPTGPPVPPKKLARHHAAWKLFVEADEIGSLLHAFARIRRMLCLPKDLWGLRMHDALVAAGERTMTVRVHQMIKVLSQQRQRRAVAAPLLAGAGGAAVTASAGGAPMNVVVSGAGPVGLRCAVECAMHGMDVTVIEKREIFSRVNILTLWPQTADDLMGFGAKLYW